MSDHTPEILTGVSVGAPAHGGHCVARVDGRVVFVRHTAPGEVVDVRLTDAGDGRRFWRGEAVTVHEASPDRVPSVWPEAGPGGVGGGELAHLSLPAQRRWKAEVLRDALTRIGRFAPDAFGDLTVAALGADDETGGLGTRSRIDLVLDTHGRAGMFRHRSHDVVALEEMPLAVSAIGDLDLFADGRWAGLPPGTRIDVVAPADGAPLVIAAGQLLLPDGSPPRPVTEHRPAGPRPGRRGARRDTRGRGGRRDQRRPAPVPDAGLTVREMVTGPFGELRYEVGAQGFWQVHRDAPATLVGAVLDAVGPVDGGRVVDMYSGAGLFTLPLAVAVGTGGQVDAIEVDPGAVRHARRNLRDVPQAEVHVAPVTPAVVGELGADGRAVDVVVLDPPRSGAGEAVAAAVAALRPARIVYVACDPAALARDLRALGSHGYRATSLQGYDLFPHTHHVECVAVLERTAG
ncbi:TRAM domain-containing protein [Georgenia sp. MJ173]|uniref:class I SAM-dependent RNA methyltransferase n=1 Tax=Georgenia sunbinii TaxID=3117728 RepID=UPI002F26D828